METNLGKPNTPMNVGTTSPAQPTVSQQTTQAIKTQQAVAQQTQVQNFYPEKPGFRGVVDKVMAMLPGSPAGQLRKIQDKSNHDPQFKGWSSGGKAKPPVPPMADMMPEVDEQVVLNPFGQNAPARQSYDNALAWAGAYAAHQGYGKYNQDPVQTDWYMLNQLMAVQAGERGNLV